MRPYGRPRRSEGYFGPEGRRPKAGIGEPVSVEGVLTPIYSRIISDRLDLYKGVFQSLFILYLVYHPNNSDPSELPPPSEYEALHPFIHHSSAVRLLARSLVACAGILAFTIGGHYTTDRGR